MHAILLKMLLLFSSPCIFQAYLNRKAFEWLDLQYLNRWIQEALKKMVTEVFRFKSGIFLLLGTLEILSLHDTSIGCEDLRNRIIAAGHSIRNTQAICAGCSEELSVHVFWRRLLRQLMALYTKFKRHRRISYH